MKNITVENSQEILKEMFSRVGETYTEEFTKQENWFQKRTWTSEEEKDFRTWLGKYLVKNKLVRKGKKRGMNTGYYEAGKLLFNYGWSIKDETT